MGTKEAKGGRVDDAIFKLYSNGYYTGKDAYLYSFSRASLETLAGRMVSDYQGALSALDETAGNRRARDLDRVSQFHSANLRWDATLKARLKSGNQGSYDRRHLRQALYRPFVPTHCYADPLFAKRPRPMASKAFPTGQSNRAICVSGIGSTKPFSVLVVNRMPDLEVISKGQCFPRYRYDAPASGQRDLLDDTASLVRIDNISDTALRAFQVAAADSAITKDAIFNYVYGLLHASDYRERFANDLAKGLPRIPRLGRDSFWRFAEAGNALAELHLGYESCTEWPLDVVAAKESDELTPEHFRLGARAMRFADKDERTTLVINEHVRLAGIPAEAHQHVVNGKTPLRWLMTYYKVETDKKSGIVNDANGWFDDPRDLVTTIQRVVHVSVNTARIVRSLPPALAE